MGEDRKALEYWIKQDLRHRRYFQEAILVWKATAIQSNQDGFDVEKALLRFKEETGKVYSVQFYKRILWVSSVAIVLLLGGLVSFAVLWKKEKMANGIEEEYKEYIVEVPASAKSKVTFPDGSVAWLNSGSKIKYDSDFGRASRNLMLIGEGYFEVNRNEKLPFVVTTEKLTVEVLGTKFNLKSYSEDESVKVVLKEGSVKVDNIAAHKEPVLLKPNQQLTYLKSNQQMILDSIDASRAKDWCDGVMFFDRVSLAEITNELRRVYDIPFHIESDRLKQIVYYSDFKETLPVEKVLEILSSGHKFKYEVKPDLIRIYN